MASKPSPFTLAVEKIQERLVELRQKGWSDTDLFGDPTEDHNPQRSVALQLRPHQDIGRIFEDRIEFLGRPHPAGPRPILVYRKTLI